ncbi:TetR/AcrR family transcriptional repressor of nem operon [Allocatelliglobosispora scoriae]|uniref:TetR/AcrR family transcriptional repressor of nem operon n=1 Tax=Allocatelliglobosispora scoriae TaxID=643052 RepID=A0A841BIJ4_9ACTN|nr:TetR/AcrR family transcriptional regulator [Allocatelliglobosispora scoriae]MBB5867425.1 TetR/AcrR family transcriptional repressor of nem operon [Allocatelliglobosispora scoriae]
MARDSTATRERILQAAERLVLEYGFGSTTVDGVVAASGTSKGAFFHHFAGKDDLAKALVARIAAADHHVLAAALDSIAPLTEPTARLLEFLAYFERSADTVTAEESGCLYISVLTERQLIDTGTADQIVAVVHAWRAALTDLIQDAFHGRPPTGIDAERLADHFFVTFEGAFLLSRATGEPHLAAQLRVMRLMVTALLT